MLLRKLTNSAEGVDKTSNETHRMPYDPNQGTYTLHGRHT